MTGQRDGRGAGSQTSKPVLFDWQGGMQRVNEGRKVFTATEVGILMMLSTWANTDDGGKIFPGTTLLAERSSSTREKVSATLAKARELGVIERVRESSGSKLADEYRLCRPSEWTAQLSPDSRTRTDSDPVEPSPDSRPTESGFPAEPSPDSRTPTTDLPTNPPVHVIPAAVKSGGSAWERAKKGYIEEATPVDEPPAMAPVATMRRPSDLEAPESEVIGSLPKDSPVEGWRRHLAS